MLVVDKVLIGGFLLVFLEGLHHFVLMDLQFFIAQFIQIERIVVNILQILLGGIFPSAAQVVGVVIDGILIKIYAVKGALVLQRGLGLLLLNCVIAHRSLRFCSAVIVGGGLAFGAWCLVGAGLILNEIIDLKHTLFTRNRLWNSSLQLFNQT